MTQPSPGLKHIEQGSLDGLEHSGAETGAEHAHAFLKTGVAFAKTGSVES